MKKLICLTILITAFSSLFAQQDTKAKEILDKVSAKNKSYTSIKADFTFSIDNKQEDIHEVSEGSIILKGDKYRLDLMGVESYCDGTTMYSYLIDAEEVSIRDIDEEDEDESALNPTKIFAIYETGFKYKYLSEEIENDKNLHIIDLFPIDLEKEFSRIRLKIDKNEMQILSLISFGKDGNNITIELKNLTPNVEFNDSDFIFDVKLHPDVEINDMR